MMLGQSKAIEIGRLLRASTSGFVAGCHVSQMNSPALGSLVRVPLGDDYQIYGLIYDIRVDDDGLVRQLSALEQVDESILLDTRLNRNVPIEMGILAVGYTQEGRISHLLPPRPALSLDLLYLCADEEVCSFTTSGHFGYFRHILRATDLPLSEILVTHLQQASAAQRKTGDPAWLERATQELIILLRDDYPSLMGLLSALADIS
jgi:hypothetical protein